MADAWTLHPQLDAIREPRRSALSRVLVNQRRELSLAAAGSARPDITEVIDSTRWTGAN